MSQTQHDRDILDGRIATDTVIRDTMESLCRNVTSFVVRLPETFSGYTQKMAEKIASERLYARISERDRIVKIINEKIPDSPVLIEQIMREVNKVE